MGLLCLEKTHSSFHTKAFRTASAKRIGGFLSTSGLKRSLRLKKKQKKKKKKLPYRLHPAGLHVTLCTSPRSSSTSIWCAAGLCTVQFWGNIALKGSYVLRIRNIYISFSTSKQFLRTSHSILGLRGKATVLLQHYYFQHLPIWQPEVEPVFAMSSG